MIYVGALAAMVALRFLLHEYTERNKKIFTLCAFLLLSFIAAFRDVSVGRDTASFCNIFSDIWWRGFEGALRYQSWTEPGFRLLCAAIGFFTNDPQWLIIVTSLLIHGFISLAIYRQSRNVYLSFFLYMALMLYPYYLSMMRQALAIAILLFALEFLKKRKWIVYALLVLLAFSFHTSAIVFLAAPLLLLIPVNRKTLSILLPAFAAAAVIATAFASIFVNALLRLFSKYSAYEQSSFDALYYYFAVFAVFAVYGAVRLYFTVPATDPARLDAPPRARTAAGVDEVGFMTTLMLLGLIPAAAMTQFGIIERVFKYFEVFYLLWIPLFLPPFDFDKQKRRLGFRAETLFIGFFCLAYFAIVLFMRSAQWYDALPYRFFWQ